MQIKMNESLTPLYLQISSDRHKKLKTYAVLNEQSMVQVIEDLIDQLEFK